MPPSSTTLFTASLQCPEKTILSLNLHNELLGSYHKNLDGIEYIDDCQKFIKILKLIYNNQYHKKNKINIRKFKSKGLIEIIEKLFLNNR